MMVHLSDYRSPEDSGRQTSGLDGDDIAAAWRLLVSLDDDATNAYRELRRLYGPQHEHTARLRAAVESIVDVCQDVMDDRDER